MTTEDTPSTTTEDTPSIMEESDSGGAEQSGGSAVSDVPGLSIVYVSGAVGCCSIAQDESTGEYTVTFSGISEDTEYQVSGTLKGCIVVDVGDDCDFKLGLNGASISSSQNAPVMCISGGNFVLAAVSGTVNHVTDSRVEQTDSDAVKSCIYSECDLKIQGNGTLVVVSENNNGIHSKDDLDVKNLTLSVTCVDNALKGNDSVTISSGSIALVAESGDGIVTTSTDLSSKGVQRGTISINSDKGDTALTIDAYCDGIDAAYDVTIEETEGNKVTVTIKTYTGASASSSSRTSGGWGGSRFGGSWGQAGPDSNKSAEVSFSCKGIKADNSVTISSGTVTVDSYDDAIHANGDVTIESTASYGSGDVSIAGGTVVLSSSDDGIHADGQVHIGGGKVSVSQSYEGMEGSSVTLSGGAVFVRSSDDGINSSGTIALTGGYVMVYAGGDGIDSNCSVRHKGIVFGGATVGIVSTSGGNSAIDTDSGYTYTGGKVLAICPQGMTQECLNCSGGVSSVGKYGTASVSSGSFVSASVSSSPEMAVKMPVSLSNAFVLYLGSSSASLSTSSAAGGLSEVAGYLYA